MANCLKYSPGRKQTFAMSYNMTGYSRITELFLLRLENYQNSQFYRYAILIFI